MEFCTHIHTHFGESAGVLSVCVYVCMCMCVYVCELFSVFVCVLAFVL